MVVGIVDLAKKDPDDSVERSGSWQVSWEERVKNMDDSFERSVDNSNKKFMGYATLVLSFFSL